MLRVVELFAGIGAQAAALDLIGAEWESVGIVEIDPYCVTAYNAIHGTDYKPSDITKVERLPECDLLTYSFPCTDISNAGKQKGFAEGSGTRSSLLWEVRRLLRAYTENGGAPPKYLLMENVKALVQKKFKPHFVPYGTVCESEGEIITKDGNALVLATSENAHQYFARDDDGCGLERGRLTQAIQASLRAPAKQESAANRQKRQAAWERIWGDPKLQQYKMREHADYWLWNHAFFNADIETLEYILQVIGGGTCTK